MNFRKSILFIALICSVGMMAQRVLVHPGLSHKQSDLDRMRYMVEAEEEPYLTSFKNLKLDGSSSYDYSVKGIDTMTTITQNGLNYSAFSSDIRAAYLNALMWSVTEDTRHADKCVEIFKAWSNITCFTGGGTESLNCGRVIWSMLEAAEIIKSTYSGWQAVDIQKFGAMLVYPGLSHTAQPNSVTKNNGSFYWRMYLGDAGRHGNQDLFGWRGIMAMGVFLDDEVMYERALLYLKGLPHRSDDIAYVSGPPITGTSPSATNDYFDTYKVQGRSTSVADYGYNGVIEHYIWENGQCQETSRDQGHTVLGVGMLASLAEIAWTQGDDLYSFLDNRILLGYEYSLRYNVSYQYTYDDQPAPWEPSVANGELIQRRDRSGRWFSKKANGFTEGDFERVSRGTFKSDVRPIYELAYAHYKVRQGVDEESMKWLIRARDISLNEIGQEQNGWSRDHLGWGGLTCVRPIGCAGDPIRGFEASTPLFAMSVLPGTVEAENYDYFSGDPEGRVYHDTGDDNSSSAYRSDDVDIATASEGDYAIVDMDAGEWLTYTCAVQTSGTYQLEVRYAAVNGDGTIRFEVGGQDMTGDVTLESTGSLTTWATKTINRNLGLSQGVYSFRIYVGGSNDAYSLNNFSLSLLQTNTAPKVAISYPTSTTSLSQGGRVTITADASDAEGSVEKVDFYIDSTLFASETTSPYSATWSHLPVGTYSIRAVATDNDKAVSTSESIRVIVQSADGGVQSGVLLSPVADSYVFSSNPGTNYGSGTNMVTKSEGRYIFVKFDLSEIDGPISSAFFKLYSRSSKSEARSIFQVSNDVWTEDGITWSNQPAIDSEIQSIKVSKGYNTWDVTNFVAIENGGDKLVTLCIKDVNDTGNGIDFYPKEYGSNAPSLTLLKTVFSTATSTLDRDVFSSFPNPVVSDLYLRTGGAYSKLSIYNLSGHLVYSTSLDVHQKDVTVAMGDYSTGMYVLLLEGNGKTITHKVMKE